MSDEVIDVDMSPVLRAIGRLVVNFNSAEHILRRIAFLLINANDERIGEIIIDRQNTSSLEDLVRALSDYRLISYPGLSEHVGCAINQFSELRVRRNEIVHALWRIPNDSIDAGNIEAVRVQLRKGTNKYISSMSPDITNDTALEAVRLCSELEDLYNKVHVAILNYKLTL